MDDEITKKYLAYQLKKMIDKLGRTPSFKEIDDALSCKAQIIKIYGTYSNFLEANKCSKHQKSAFKSFLIYENDLLVFQGTANECCEFLDICRTSFFEYVNNGKTFRKKYKVAREYYDTY